MAQNKLVAVSGVQPSGELHIGNYLGVIKPMVDLQDNYNMFAFIVDLHAITVPQEPKKLLAQTFDVAAIYLACGLDPKKTTIFIQSHVPQHTELGWILNTITPLGELERMTQFKEKSEEMGVLAGLLNYPVLMAADILLYQPDIVPVGEDQLQHLELARTLARKFNSKFGKTFKEPKALVQKNGARIMGLDDPSKKMSKSASSTNNYINLLDDEKEILRKIKIAVTDSGNEIKYDPAAKPAISNLLSIYSNMTNTSIPELENKYRGVQYSAFKLELADAIIHALSPIQERYNKFAKDKKSVLGILKDGAKKAEKVAETTMKDVRAKIGLLEI